MLAPRVGKAPEGDQQADEEHPDQHRHPRGDGRREARRQRAPSLCRDDPEPHSDAYPPRRSSRESRPSSSAMTRLRILSTISRSWVTIRIVVPLMLMRYRSCMIPTEVSGSRLPVGSSQTRSGGWFTNARAIETRCCSPPDISSGSEFILWARPTMFMTSGTFRRIELALSPC